MKKSDKIMLAIYIVIGIALVIIGVTIQVDYYSSMIFAMGFALIFSSIMQFRETLSPYKTRKCRGIS